MLFFYNDVFCITVTAVPTEPPASPITRTQSDLSHVKSYIDELEMKKIQQQVSFEQM